MRKKQFYDPVISIYAIEIELHHLDLSDKERAHLLDIVSSHLHNTILDTVLTHLTTDDKKQFLTHIKNDDHEQTWQFLREKIENIEEEIITTANLLKKELLADIHQIKKRK